uniref:Uncharacterized protein n=1 Tax=Glossina pallidipes TaxID=7398 RepID=A0A1A9ZAI7_GLOPL
MKIDEAKAQVNRRNSSKSNERSFGLATDRAPALSCLMEYQRVRKASLHFIMNSHKIRIICKGSVPRGHKISNKLDKYWYEAFNQYLPRIISYSGLSPLGMTACSSCLFSDPINNIFIRIFVIIAIPGNARGRFTVAAALIYTMFILILTNVKQAERTFTDSYKIYLPKQDCCGMKLNKSQLTLAIFRNN